MEFYVRLIRPRGFFEGQVREYPLLKEVLERFELERPKSISVVDNVESDTLKITESSVEDARITLKSLEHLYEIYATARGEKIRNLASESLF